MVGSKMGGINVFGGGLALYAAGKVLVGGLGLSGDTSCVDHFIAWWVRKNLGLDHLAGVDGVSGDPARPDNIIFTPFFRPARSGIPPASIPVIQPRCPRCNPNFAD